jgi:hypothetical protein
MQEADDDGSNLPADLASRIVVLLRHATLRLMEKLVRRSPAGMS